MNRKSLLTLLKANGYAEANPTIESVKSYLAKLASEGVELQDKEGNPLNIDTIWAAKSVLTPAGTDADTALSEPQRKSIIADAKGKDSAADGIPMVAAMLALYAKAESMVRTPHILISD